MIHRDDLADAERIRLDDVADLYYLFHWAMPPYRIDSLGAPTCASGVRRRVPRCAWSRQPLSRP